MADRSAFTIRIFNIVQPVTSMYPDLIPYWQAMGWQVEVVISRAQYRADRPLSWTANCSRIHWTPSLGLQFERPLAKLVIMLAYSIKAALLSLFGRQVNHNLFLTQPPLFFAWGAVLQRLRRQPYTIALMDLYPDVAVQAGLLKKEGWIALLLRRLSGYGLRRADRVIAIGRCMQEHLVASGVDPSRIEVIPNWTDEETIRPLPHPKNDLRRRMGWQDKSVILYSGNLGLSHYFEDILQVALHLQYRPELVFAFMGDGRRRAEIERFKAQHQLANIELLPFQPQNQLELSLGAGDLHFVCLRPEFTGLVVPSKIYGVLAAGRPLLFQGGKEGEIARLIVEEDVGQVVVPGDVAGLEKAILSYLGDPSLTRRQGENARRLAEGRYSKRQARRSYTALLSPAGETVRSDQSSQEKSLATRKAVFEE